MKLAKWGNSLAVRIPAEVVGQLGIAANEEVEIKVTGTDSFEVVRDRRREQAIEKMRRLAVPIPEGYKFNRDEINDRFERSKLGRAMAAAEAEAKLDSTRESVDQP